VRLLLVIALVALAGCKSKPADAPLPPAVATPKEVALTSVGSTLDVIDSRVAAAVAVAREANTAGKPAVVESELSVAGSFLPKATEGDLAYARQRSEKASPADYERQRAKAAEKQKAAEAAWADLEKQVAANKAALAARDARIVELAAEVERVKKDKAAQLWTMAGVGVAVVGALATAFASPKAGVPLLLCGGAIGAFPFAVDSPWFAWIAGAFAAVLAVLGIWVAWDAARDRVNAQPSKDEPPQA
jgi:hypothetical protein